MFEKVAYHAKRLVPGARDDPRRGAPARSPAPALPGTTWSRHRELRSIAQRTGPTAQRAALGGLHPIAPIAHDPGDVESRISVSRRRRRCGRPARAGAHARGREAQDGHLGALAARAALRDSQPRRLVGDVGERVRAMAARAIGARIRFGAAPDALHAEHAVDELLAVVGPSAIVVRFAEHHRDLAIDVAADLEVLGVALRAAGDRLGERLLVEMAHGRRMVRDQLHAGGLEFTSRPESRHASPDRGHASPRRPGRARARRA